jgi:1-acyl-sn-glycerol-3-phosphate acyltransferase
MNEFRGGVAKIVGRSKVPVIPMALRGLWGSLLTRDPGNLFERSFSRGVRSQLALAVGQPVPPQEATPEYLYEQVLALRGAWK